VVITLAEDRIRPDASEEADLLARLRAGDERAFEYVVDAYHSRMLAIARTYVKTLAVAEEVVQEAWVGVLDGLDRFEGRSSLRLWILRILVNKAITRGRRETRSIPFSSLADADEAAPAVEPERFGPRGGAFPGHWNGFPMNWSTLPEDRVLGRESVEVAKLAIEGLPVAQRRVIAMRDVAGFSAEEVCEVLDISAGNQRVILHRARSRVRAALEGHLDG
jgi:RNA polymerase sigma-70 factor (ECF subfamily)